MKQKITIQDIATLAGVAKSTVSRYLNNGYVSKEKAQLIDKVIQDTGYTSNFFAQRLKNKQSKLIGIVMSRLDSFSAGKLLSGFNTILKTAGYQPLILVSELSVENELSSIRQLIQQGVDGIIVQALAITKEHVKIAHATDIPIIFTGQAHPKVTYYKLDDFYAGELLGEYIAKAGHNRITYIGVSPQDIAVGKDRFAGFTTGINKYQPDNEINLITTDFSFEAAYAHGLQAIKHNPSAIVCATDNLALGILRYLHERHIDVPEQISLAGFGGYPVGEISYPSLTTLAFDYKHLGATVAHKLLSKLHGNVISSELSRQFYLYTRESTAKLSSQN